MISDVDTDRIATAVVRKLAEAELDRLLEELAFEERLTVYEADRRKLLAGRAKRFGFVKIVTVVLLAVIYVLMFEAL